MTEYVDVGGNEPKRPFQTPDIAKRAKQTAVHIKRLADDNGNTTPKQKLYTFDCSVPQREDDSGVLPTRDEYKLLGQVSQLQERVKFYRNLTIRVANALGVTGDGETVEDAIEQWLLRIQEK